MPVPASRAAELAARLNDKSLNLSEFELHGLRRELREMLHRGPPSSVLIDVHSALAQVEYRLHRLDENFRHAKVLYQLAPERPDIVVNYLMALVNLREYDQALRVAAHTKSFPAPFRAEGFLMGAVIHFRRGELSEAHREARSALEVVDFQHPDQLLRVSQVFAEVGFGSEGVELFARYLALVTHESLGDQRATSFIQSVQQRRPELFWVLDHSYPLQAALAKELRLGELQEQGDGADEKLPSDESEASRLLDELEPLREEAMRATFDRPKE